MNALSLNPISEIALASRLPAVGSDAAAFPDELLATAYVELFRDPLRAADWARAAQAAARRSDAPVVDAYALTTQALAELLSGSEAIGAETLQQAAILAGRVQEPRLDWLVSDARALALLNQARPDEAMVELIGLMIATPDHRPLRDCYLSISSLARVHAALGHVEEAIGAGYRALSIARRTRSAVLRVHAITGLGLLQLEHEHLLGARLLLEQGLFGAGRSRSGRSMRQAARGLVRTYLALNMPDTALDVARRHLPEASDPQECLALAQVNAANGCWTEAAVYLDRGGQDGSRERQVQHAWLRGRIALAHGRPAEALTPCHAVLDENASSRDAWELALTLQAAYEALGDSSSARVHAGRADRIMTVLAARGAVLSALCAQFEQDLLQAHSVCVEMAAVLDR
ncbi:MAG: hypothetical protein JNL73_11340 [Anaerolineales bacterium]|nr:hypothetical protein [Anaerolineales bacterium]